MIMGGTGVDNNFNGGGFVDTTPPPIQTINAPNAFRPPNPPTAYKPPINSGFQPNPMGAPPMGFPPQNNGFQPAPFQPMNFQPVNVRVAQPAQPMF